MPSMLLRADFDKVEHVETGRMEWVPSPAPGVERKMLDRIGEEAARATSLVRYAPHSSFPRHGHPAGEEFLVLEGTFYDDYGEFPAGTYVRNPPGTEHEPYTREGCVIFVKLRQFLPRDLEQKVVDTRDSTAWTEFATGIEVLPLHSFGPEQVRLIRLSPGMDYQIPDGDQGTELYILGGEVKVAGQALATGDWWRSPGNRAPIVCSKSACVMAKTGPAALFGAHWL
ncbi:MAG: cupin domain-containing protein [Xanthomonadales bacterium]|nr:cupin domain-containing protein [Xanthomonadales bacterium]